MEAVKELSNINLGVLLASICVVLLAIKYIVQLFEWFITKLGLETKAMRKRREEHNLLIDTSQEMMKLKQKHDEDIKGFLDKRIHDRKQSFEIQEMLTVKMDNISSKLDEMRKENIEKDIDDMRWNILSFANKISEGKKCNKDGYVHCLKLYQKYEQLIEENGLQNGEVEVSIKIIKDSYADKLKNGFD